MIDEEQLLDLHLQGMSSRQIAVSMGCTVPTVDSNIKRLRMKYGEEVVPYATDVGYVKKNPMQSDHGLLTWAGAFKLLVRYLRDKGDAEGYAYAQEIAQRKQMSI